MDNEKRKFMNIDFSQETLPEDPEERAKKEKYLSDLARLKRIREESARTEAKQAVPGGGNAPSDSGEFRITGAGRSRAAGSSARQRDTARSRGEERSRKRKGNLLRNIVAGIVVFLLFWGAKNLFFSGETHETGFYTVAVFGVDSRDGSLGKGALSDVNMLVSLNKETGDIKICSVYRDTFVQIDSEGKHHKFNEAYFRGGPDQSLWTMKYNFDIVPDDYITFNWKAVVDAINIMGGVDLEITEPEFKYINSFITETVNSTGIGSVQLKSAGMNHLDGVQAVAYARLRLMDTDYNRTERQRKVVSLLMDKVRAADTAKRMELVTSVVPETKTSMTIDDLLVYARDIKKYHLTETTGFPFDRQAIDIEKKDCVVPVTMETNVIALHQFLYGDTGYTPSQTVKEISSYIIKKTGLKAKGDASVTTDQGGNGGVGKKTTEAAQEKKTEAVPETAAAETSAAAEASSEAAEESSAGTETSEAETSKAETVSAMTASETEAERTGTGAAAGPGAGPSGGPTAGPGGKTGGRTETSAAGPETTTGAVYDAPQKRETAPQAGPGAGL